MRLLVQIGLVALGSALGGLTRWGVTAGMARLLGTAFPWGTFTANVLACLVLGAITGAALTGAAGASTQALIGTGFCGALSTYSTFSFESFRLAEQGARFFAVANIAASIAAGEGAVFLGSAVAQAIWP